MVYALSLSEMYTCSGESAHTVSFSHATYMSSLPKSKSCSFFPFEWQVLDPFFDPIWRLVRSEKLVQHSIAVYVGSVLGVAGKLNAMWFCTMMFPDLPRSTTQGSYS